MSFEGICVYIEEIAPWMTIDFALFKEDNDGFDIKPMT